MESLNESDGPFGRTFRVPVMKKQGLFFTPKSAEELQGWIEQLPSDVKVIAYTAAGASWNLACDLVNGTLGREEG